MNIPKTILLLLLFLISNIFAEEDLYSYKFNLDSTLTGALIAEGNIFSDTETTFVLINNYKNKSISPKITFWNSSFDSIETITITSPNSHIYINPLVFDFDGDSFDEVVFTIREHSKIYLLYFDPSNTHTIQTKIFEIPIPKGPSNYYSVNLFPAQLDGDKFYELNFTLSNRMLTNFTPRGLWAIDIEKQETIWEYLTAFKISNNNLINIVDDSTSVLIYSVDSGDNSTKNISFSGGNYFLTEDNGNQIIYNKSLKEVKHAAIDTLLKDYSSNNISLIRAINCDNSIIWERKLSGMYTKTLIDTVSLNNEKRIVLVTYSTVSKKKFLSVEIVNPKTGIAEKRILLNGRLKDFGIYKNKIIISPYKNKTYLLDLGLNIIDSAKTKLWFTKINEINLGKENLLIAVEGGGMVQNLVLLDDKLNLKASNSIYGINSFLKTSNMLFAYDKIKNKTKLYSFESIPWYEQIKASTLRNLVISFLLLLVIFMLLWINTLRVSWRKIKRQKDEIETTHQELQTTTAKLIQVEKLAVYGTIASGIAHEINSPLGAIINSAQRIKESKNIDIGIEKNINLIERAGKRAKNIIEKLLIGTRNSKDYGNTNLIDAVAEWRELSSKQFENLGIKIETEIGCDHTLAISSTELNQILTNIFFNARDSIMEKNGENKSVFISSKKIEDRCSIIIKDTGTGFSQQKLDKPFEAFDTSKEKGRGTGLGLWVVKSIIDNIGGEISIKNYSLGAEVKIEIPIYSETNDV